MQTEIIVIDNNSADGSKEFFNDRFPQVKFIWHDANEGFSKANNIALKQATGKYILFLNPDTIVAEDCFIKCISFIETKENVGALGVRMIDGSGKYLKESKRAFPSLLTSFFKLSGFAKAFPKSKLFAKYYLGNLSENETAEVPVLAGAFMLIPKMVLDKTGSFDEDYFMYGEDIDLSYRILKAGYKNFYFPETTIIHFKGESTQKQNAQYVKTFYNAMSIFVKKHYDGAKAKWFNMFIQAAIFLRGMMSGFKMILTKNIKADTAKKDILYSVVATENEYNEVVNIFESAAMSGYLTERIAVENPGGIYQNIIVAKAQQIIFCAEALSYKNIIELTEKFSDVATINIHGFGTKSIVGSSDKTTMGNVISFDQ